MNDGAQVSFYCKHRLLRGRHEAIHEIPSASYPKRPYTVNGLLEIDLRQLTPPHGGTPYFASLAYEEIADTQLIAGSTRGIKVHQG
jgi:hypothetical protein